MPLTSALVGPSKPVFEMTLTMINSTYAKTLLARKARLGVVVEVSLSMLSLDTLRVNDARGDRSEGSILPEGGRLFLLMEVYAVCSAGRSTLICSDAAWLRPGFVSPALALAGKDTSDAGPGRLRSQAHRAACGSGLQGDPGQWQQGYYPWWQGSGPIGATDGLELPGAGLPQLPTMAWMGFEVYSAIPWVLMH